MSTETKAVPRRLAALNSDHRKHNSMAWPTDTNDLLPSERRFLAEMQAVWYGRVENLRIQDGELVLDPWPASIRDIRFGSTEKAKKPVPTDFLLKVHVIEFVTFVRSVSVGEIRSLEIRDGVPVFARVETPPAFKDGASR